MGDVLEGEILFKLVNHWDMVEKVSKGYKFAGTVYKTQTALKNALVSDPEIHEAVRQTIFKRILKGTG